MLTGLIVDQENLWRHGVVHDPAKKKLKVMSLLKDMKVVYSPPSFSCGVCTCFKLPPPLFQKLHPKKNQPWRKALQVKLAAAANQADANKLAAKLRNTALEDKKS